jgi:hypothetical protein
MPVRGDNFGVLRCGQIDCAESTAHKGPADLQYGALWDLRGKLLVGQRVAGVAADVVDRLVLCQELDGSVDAR